MKLGGMVGNRDLQKEGVALVFLRGLLPPPECKSDREKTTKTGDKEIQKELNIKEGDGAEKAPDTSLKIGDHVKISVTREKRKWDGCKAEITSVGAKFCKVTLLDGDHVGVTRQFGFNCLSLIEQKAPEAAPANAGMSKEEQAKQLFGDLNDI